MNIVLPESFYYKGASQNNFARVEGSDLVIRGTIPFKEMMYALTYAIKGNTKCCYCGNTIPKGSVTIDHMYPLDVGGPTIPNNMVPACSKCNCDKSNMTFAQYQKYLDEEDLREKRKIRKAINEEHELKRKEKIYELPKDWVSEIKLSTVVVELFFDEKFKGNKYQSIKEFYETYGFLKKPVIVNGSHYLFNGFTELIFARDIGLQKIPAIVLDNVKVML